MDEVDEVDVHFVHVVHWRFRATYFVIARSPSSAAPCK